MAMTQIWAIVALAMVRGGEAKTALLMIDVQECFLEGGSLAVTASHIIPKLNSIRAQKSCLFDKVFMSQDYHPAGHISFGSTHNKTAIAGAWQGMIDLTCLKPSSGLSADAACCPTFFLNSSAVDCTASWCPSSTYYTTAPGNGIITDNAACTTCATTPASCFHDTQSLWKDHCLQSGDSAFAGDLTTETTDVIVQKGTNKFVDAYSAFMDNSQFLKTSLDAALQTAGIDTLYVAGIATDVCVKWTVRDALGSKTGKYTVKVIGDASAGIYAGTGVANAAAADTWFAAQGATVVSTADVLAMNCPEATSGSAGTSGAASGSTLTSMSIQASPTSLLLLVLIMTLAALSQM